MPKHPFLLVFLLTAAFFAWVHSSPGFGDPDAYYHLEMARRTAASGPVSEFPWLPHTTLADHFADHHFLYHLALAPFVLAFGDFWGLKIATITFAALAVAAFSFALKEYGAKHPYLWTALLPLAPGFVFRLLLTKSTALALVALFLFLIALRRGSRPAAFCIAFAYVWLHGGWPLLLIAAALDASVRRSARLVPPTAFGLAAGLIVNPFFPSNLSFYWEQIVQIAVIGRRDPFILVGNEWYPAEIASLAVGNASVFLPLVAAAVLAAYAILSGRRAREGSEPGAARRKDLIFIAALAGVLFLMTLRQARHKEYFLPMALLAGALVAETAFAAVDLRAMLARSRACWGRLFAPLLVVCGVALGAFAAHSAYLPRMAYADRPDWTRFEKAGAWTSANVPAGETIFHARWDDFPQLWYRDPEHRYIAGLDALFLYRKDPEKYWLWRDIGDGRRRESMARLITEEFGARYVIVRMDPDPFRTHMKKDPSFERVYADSEAEVWRIREGR